jgi:hypothetical protein
MLMLHIEFKNVLASGAPKNISKRIAFTFTFLLSGGGLFLYL